MKRLLGCSRAPRTATLPPRRRAVEQALAEFSKRHLCSLSTIGVPPRSVWAARSWFILTIMIEMDGVVNSNITLCVIV